MSGAWSLLVLVGVVALCVTFIILVAESDNEDDWRSEHCCLECWAPDGQEKPCEDCPARRGMP